MYRCKDCFGSPICCRDCLLQTHTRTPFHRIQQWNGQFFDSTTLLNIGYILPSGHGSDACPHSSSAHDALICIVDVIGVFHHKLRWCSCQNAEPRYAQLLRLGLYPASVERPETAFTFSLLDYFQVDAVECKTSANNFFNKLRRLTNSLFPQTVPVSLSSIIIIFDSNGMIFRIAIVNS
jgi:CxC2 like cysteine cluster associated with KDZ transposases